MSFRSFTEKTYLIAEAGVNHNGSLETALKLCEMAKNSGANYVKFQKRDNKYLLGKKYYEKQVRKLFFLLIRNLQTCWTGRIFILRFPDCQISKFPDFQITRFPDSPISRFMAVSQR